MDVFHVFQRNRSAIKNPLLRELGEMDALVEYSDEIGDSTLKLAINLVLTCQDELPHFIQQIREALLEEPYRHLAEGLYSRVHRCKGLEYDSVSVQDDF